MHPLSRPLPASFLLINVVTVHHLIHLEGLVILIYHLFQYFINDQSLQEVPLQKQSQGRSSPTSQAQQILALVHLSWSVSS